MSGLIPTFVQWKYPLGIPYDAINPAVKGDLKNRMCSICGMYFGTIKMLVSMLTTMLKAKTHWVLRRTLLKK